MSLAQSASEDVASTSVRPAPAVLLISMPFGPLLQPSIGLGLLQAALQRQQVATKSLYFTLQFSKIIGPAAYGRIANGEALTFDLAGEWIFAETLFGPSQYSEDDYIEDILRRRLPGYPEAKPVSDDHIAELREARSKAEAFLDETLATVLAYNPQVIGFTSIFQQQVASLSLAKRIKAARPEIKIVFGGANCEGAMGVEMIRQFPFVDAVVSGEGDYAFPELVQRLLNQQAWHDLRGVFTQRNVDLLGINGQAYPTAASVRVMDDLPIPAYEDFFEQLAAAELDVKIKPRLLFETSRGCWWGEKNHCTFCGLNGSTMTFRSKSADRALEELTYLAEHYPNSPISVVDNILDMKYFKTFVPALAARALNLELFYEVKANLRKEQVRLLRDAGITVIQPGVESLSTAVLDLMRKGVKGFQNIQLLKWCKEYGVRPYWNMLWGFPGEDPAEYERISSMLPLLTHLHPPTASATIRLDRFSPNFDDAGNLGFSNVRPYPAYHYVYALPPAAVANLAYFFTYDYTEPRDVLSYTRPVRSQMQAWKEVHPHSDLFSVDKGTSLLLCDLRPVAQQPFTVLRGAQRILYLACDAIQNLNQLQAAVAAQTGETVLLPDIEALLQPLLDQGVLLREGNTFLSLAIPLGDYSPNKATLERLQQLLQTHGTSNGKTVVVPVAQDMLVEEEVPM